MRDDDDPPTQALERGDGRLEPVLQLVAHRDVGTEAGERERRGLTDALGRTGHDGDATR